MAIHPFPRSHLAISSAQSGRSLFLAAVVGLLILQGCTTLPGPSETDTPVEPPPPDVSRAPAKKGAVTPAALPQTGEASWYGAQHQGKRTASGSLYDQAKLTAAHRSLPFGTRVRVTNVSNGKSVDVAITDRGPYVGNRIIDLSRAAAQALGMIESGTATVRLEAAGD
jgi:rare lipoprotein A